jgi:hypothetical protein
MLSSIISCISAFLSRPFFSQDILFACALYLAWRMEVSGTSRGVQGLAVFTQISYQSFKKKVATSEAGFVR